MTAIKAIITDVDGVMVGKQEGVNFPLPQKGILNTLKQISAGGIPIVLCTAKFGNAIKDIGIQAKLHNPHITDGGAVIVDWLGQQIIAQHALRKEIVYAIIQASLEQNIYTEIYTVDNYYVQKSQKSDFIAKRTKVTKMPPQLVSSLQKIVKEKEVIKVICMSEDKDATKLQNIIRPFTGEVTYIWSKHPFLRPRQIMVITALQASKQQAAKEVADYLNIAFDDILGIGDSESDWSFMQLCGYAAALDSDDDKLVKHVKTKGKGHFFVAPSVEEHGLFQVFQYFGLVS